MAGSPATPPGLAFISHSIAETDEDIIALICAAEEIAFGTGFLVAHAQHQVDALVSCERFPRRLRDEPHEPRNVSGTAGRVSSLRRLLERLSFASAVGGRWVRSGSRVCHWVGRLEVAQTAMWTRALPCHRGDRRRAPCTPIDRLVHVLTAERFSFRSCCPGSVRLWTAASSPSWGPRVAHIYLWLIEMRLNWITLIWIRAGSEPAGTEPKSGTDGRHPKSR